MGYVPNRDVNIFDIIAVLDAFSDVDYPDLDPCVPGQGPNQLSSATSALLRLNPAQRSILPGDDVVVEIFLDSAIALRGYQLALTGRIHGSGTLKLVDAWIDTERADFALAGQPMYAVGDQSRGRVAASLMQGTHVPASGSYLASFLYQTSRQAQGYVEFRFVSDDEVLAASTVETFPVRNSKPLVIPITQASLRKSSREH